MFDKILVQWIGGRSDGKQCFVKRINIKEGTLAPEKKVKVNWGKSKKLFEAVIMDNQCSPAIPVQPGSCTTNRTADKDVRFELGSPIYTVSTSFEHLNQHSSSEDTNCSDFYETITELRSEITTLNNAVEGLYQTPCSRGYSAAISRCTQ